MRRNPAFLLAAVLAAAPFAVAVAQPPASAPKAATTTAPTAAVNASSFRITLDPTLHAAPLNGRVYIVLSKGDREPRRQMGNWFGKTQILARDVTNSSGPIDLGTQSLAWPDAFDKIPPGEYQAQAVARLSLDSPHVGSGEGDLYSDPVAINFTREGPGAGALELKLSRIAHEAPFKESDRVKEVTIVSPSLSKFYAREIKVSAGVVLPEGWKDDPAINYPTVYFITGFGGSHKSASQMMRMLPSGGPAAILVVPDPSCHYGHSVFADSANNGPRGQSLIEELIPAVEEKFHGARSADRRFLTGISSGGWGSLWLQITYPDSFNGVWSHCPDPVDFRDFQRIPLYDKSANMYTDDKGHKRPLARRGTEPSLWYEDFVRQEWALGDGGQIQSFEAVFSPRGPDGRPKLLFDRATGNVNPDVARSWEKYDINLILERNWPALAPKLQGKLHIYAGALDTFYLDGAAKLLKETLIKLGSDAEVEIVPEMPHTIYPAGMAAMWKTIAEKCK